MPGIFQQSVDRIVEECREVAGLGIPAVILFGLPEHKDELGTEAADAHGAVQRSIEAIRKAKLNLLVIADVCVDKQAPSAVAAELRLLYPHARVLFMSGYPEDHLLGDGLLEHGAAFLAKQFFPDVLLRCVRDILDSETAAPRTLRAAG